MRVILVCAALVWLLGCTSRSSSWKPVWSDEFEYEELPGSTKWGYAIGGHGWGNQELQYHTSRHRENAEVRGGNCTLLPVINP